MKRMGGGQRSEAINEDEKESQENLVQREEIEAAGLDYDDLENMDEEERAKILREAGLDPDDFDF